MSAVNWDDFDIQNEKPMKEAKRERRKRTKRDMRREGERERATRAVGGPRKLSEGREGPKIELCPFN